VSVPPIPPIGPERRRKRARLAALERHHPDQPELIDAARAELRVATLEDHILAVVDDLRPEQKAALAKLLRTPGGAA
jgi:hypothetical protein